MTGPRAPTNCPACGTSVPPGATRCPACGRVFGEVNRCPSCNAIAAVRQTQDGFVCAACGAPREVRPGTNVLGGGGPTTLAHANPKATWAKSVAASGGAIGLRVAAVAVAGAGLTVGGIVALVAGAGIGYFAGGLVSLGALGVSGLLFVLGGRASRSAVRMSSSADELEILALAEKLGGSLYATDVARAMGVSVAEAEARLAAIQDGVRVVSEVTPEGLIRFEFRELRARTPVRPVRIAPPDAVADAEIEVPTSSGQDASKKSGV